jgi:hypothetical protein
MADHSLREPDQILADCAGKLKPIETGGLFTAIRAAQLDEDWTTPKIGELFITSDRCVLAPTNGRVDPQTVYRGRGRPMASRFDCPTDAAPSGA